MCTAGEHTGGSTDGVGSNRSMSEGDRDAAGTEAWGGRVATVAGSGAPDAVVVACSVSDVSWESVKYRVELELDG